MIGGKINHMNIQPINNTSFQKKQRFITTTMQNNAKQLLDKMSDETQQINKHLQKRCCMELDISKKGTFIDESSIYGTSKPQRFGIKIGKDVFYVNNDTREIEFYHKQSFFLWSNIMKKIEKMLSDAVEHYNNTDVVKKIVKEIEIINCG